MLKNSLANYQKVVKEEKMKFFSKVISDNANRPKVLFNTIDSILNPPRNVMRDATQETCEEFLLFFTQKN